MTPRKFTYEVVKEILNKPMVASVEWSQRIDRTYKCFFRSEMPTSLCDKGINKIVVEQPPQFEDDIFLNLMDGSREKFAVIDWRL